MGKLNPKATKHPKPEIKIPDYFREALVKNKVAEENFNAMSPSHQREYLEWIMEAKAEETRNRRIEKTILQLSEKKSLN